MRLMANMMLLEQVGETAEVAVAELYSPNEDLHISKHFRNSQPDALTGKSVAECAKTKHACSRHSVADIQYIIHVAVIV